MAFNFARGKAAIEEAAKSGGKKFSPFVPQIAWKDGDEKYIRFLTPIDEAVSVLLHEWIECGEKVYNAGTKDEKRFPDWGFFISRKDPAIGEDVDPLTEKGSTPKKRILAVAVELEPIMAETGTGRSRPKGFTVKTQEYTRKTDDGDVEVVAPVIGVITQASKNFFKLLVSHSETEGPIEDTVFKVRRIGGDSETAYNFTTYFDQPMDMNGLIDNIDGVSYLESDDDAWAEIETVLSECDSEDEQAMGIAAVLLNKRLNELADKELYDEMTGHIEEIKSKYEKTDKKQQDRPARRSQRGSKSGATSTEDAATRRSDRFAEIKRLAAEKKKGSA